MRAVVRSVGAYIPIRRMSNHEFSEFLDTSDEWIVSHTGIKYRHIAAGNQAASDLAAEAAQKAIQRAGMSPGDIDLILLATATGDFNGFPATACIVQEMIGAKHAAAMDITAGCTGFIYGIETARSFIEAGSTQNVLLVCTEVLSRIMNWNDRNTCVLFGDGAGAVLLSAQDGESSNGVLASYLRAEGAGARMLERTAGGTRFPYNPKQTNTDELYLRMDGRGVYNFAVRVIIEAVEAILVQNDLSVDDVQHIVPHQANIRIVQASAKRAKIPMDKFYMNIQEYANTSAASIPLALNEMHEKGILREGDLVLTVGFGAGLTYGSNLIRW